MHDERMVVTMTAEVILEEREHRRRWITVRKRNAQQPCRLVDDEKQIVLEQDLQLAELEWS